MLRFALWAARMRVAVVLAASCVSAAAFAQDYVQERASKFTYVANGLLASETIEPGNPQLCVTTTYSYDDFGNKTGVTTANCPNASGLALFDSKASSTRFDAASSAIANPPVAIPAGTFATSARVAVTANIGEAASHTERREYDPRFGVVTKLTGPNGLDTSWELDAFGRKTKEVRADNTQSIVRYCLITGRISNTGSNSEGCTTPAETPAAAVSYEHTESQTTAGAKLGPWVRVYYDAAGRKIRNATEGFDGATVVQDTDYDDHGAVTVATQPYFLSSGASTTTGSNNVGLSKTVYDELGRVTAVYVTDPKIPNQQSGGSEESIPFGSPGSYRAAKTTIAYNGLEVTTTDDQNRTRREEKSPEGKTVRVTDALGAQIVHQHDAGGNLVQTTDALGNVITVVYDVRGRKLRLEDPDAGATAYCYDALGQLRAQQTSAMRGNHGAATCPAYDGRGTTAPGVAGWTTLAYDRLGRLTSRVEPELASTFTYDKYADGSSCTAGKGKLCQSTTTNGISRKNYFDDRGRPLSTRVDATNGSSPAIAASMITGVSYNSVTGRVDTQTYPTGLALRYGYNDRGYLNIVKAATTLTVAGTTQQTLWEGLTYNAWGRIESQRYGGSNGVVNRAIFEPMTGRLQQLTAGVGTANDVVNQKLMWDSVGKLTSRVDASDTATTGFDISDTYVYDALGRLTQYTVGGSGVSNVRTVDMQYNALGMLLYKSDVGIYTYPAQGTSFSKPHAVQAINGVLANGYTYDLNGNAKSASNGKWRGVTYTSFNLPDGQDGLQGASGTKYTWRYDESHARFHEIRTNAQGTRVTWNLHPDNQGGLGFEREEGPTGPAQNRHYITAGGAVIGVIVTEGALPSSKGNPTAPPSIESIVAVKLEYWHKDHLGSLIATTNHAAAVTARYSYDPFGKRRYITGAYDISGNLVVDWAAGTTPGTDRGFTGHEHLDDVGIVHMNGRLFDPNIGRFMQGDPLIQDPTNLQNYDRFAYCFSNPNTCTDPSGYKFSFKSIIKIAVIVAVSYFTAGAATGWMVSSATSGFLAGGGLSTAFVTIGVGEAAVFSTLGTVVSAAAGGFAAGAVAGGSFKSGVQGAFSAAVFAGVGEVFGDAGLTNGGSQVADSGKFAGAVAAHGVAGCVTSVSSGGKCGPGALSAAFSKAALPMTSGLNDGIPRGIAHAVIGGTASELGGGKFSNGAMTGAFSYLFNELLHRHDGTAAGRRKAMLLSGYSDGGSTFPYDPPLEGVYPEAYLLGTGGLISAAGNGLKLAFSGGANSVFWSGYSMGALETATSLGTTLEATIGGRFLSWVNYQVGIKVPDSVWNWASSTFANQASGTAQAVIRAEGRVWTTIEKPILQQRGVLIEYRP